MMGMGNGRDVVLCETVEAEPHQGRWNRVAGGPSQPLLTTPMTMTLDEREAISIHQWALPGKMKPWVVVYLPGIPLRR